MARGIGGTIRYDAQGTREVTAAQQRIARGQQRLGKAFESSFERSNRATRRNTQLLNQFGLQAQDVAVQFQSGTSPFVILGQQGSQLLGVLGPGGAIAGALLAFGALAGSAFTGFRFGAENAIESAEEFRETLEFLELSARDTEETFAKLAQSLDPIRGGARGAAALQIDLDRSAIEDAIRDVQEAATDALSDAFDNAELVRGLTDNAARFGQELSAEVERGLARSEALLSIRDRLQADAGLENLTAILGELQAVRAQSPEGERAVSDEQLRGLIEQYRNLVVLVQSFEDNQAAGSVVAGEQIQALDAQIAKTKDAIDEIDDLAQRNLANLRNDASAVADEITSLVQQIREDSLGPARIRDVDPRFNETDDLGNITQDVLRNEAVGEIFDDLDRILRDFAESGNVQAAADAIRSIGEEFPEIDIEPFIDRLVANNVEFEQQVARRAELVEQLRAFGADRELAEAERAALDASRERFEEQFGQSAREFFDDVIEDVDKSAAKFRDIEQRLNATQDFEQSSGAVQKLAEDLAVLRQQLGLVPEELIDTGDAASRIEEISREVEALGETVSQALVNEFSVELGREIASLEDQLEAALGGTGDLEQLRRERSASEEIDDLVEEAGGLGGADRGDLEYLIDERERLVESIRTAERAGQHLETGAARLAGLRTQADLAESLSIGEDGREALELAEARTKVQQSLARLGDELDAGQAAKLESQAEAIAIEEERLRLATERRKEAEKLLESIQDETAELASLSGFDSLLVDFDDADVEKTRRQLTEFRADLEALGTVPGVEQLTAALAAFESQILATAEASEVLRASEFADALEESVQTANAQIEAARTGFEELERLQIQNEARELVEDEGFQPGERSDLVALQVEALQRQELAEATAAGAATLLELERDRDIALRRLQVFQDASLATEEERESAIAALNDEIEAQNSLLQDGLEINDESLPQRIALIAETREAAEAQAEENEAIAERNNLLSGVSGAATGALRGVGQEVIGALDDAFRGEFQGFDSLADGIGNALLSVPGDIAGQFLDSFVTNIGDGLTNTLKDAFAEGFSLEGLQQLAQDPFAAGGLGIAAGTTLTALTGGNTQNASIGGLLGSGLGAGAGFLFGGPAGTAIGAGLGGLFGSGLGGLFGGNSRNRAQEFVDLETGRRRGDRSPGRGDPNREAAIAIAEAASGFRNVVLASGGDFADLLLNVQVSENRDAGESNEIVVNQLLEALTFSAGQGGLQINERIFRGENVGRLFNAAAEVLTEQQARILNRIQNSGADTVEELLADFVTLRGLNDISTGVSDFDIALRNLRVGFEDTIQDARRLRVNISPIVDAQEDAIIELFAQSFPFAISTAGREVEELAQSFADAREAAARLGIEANVSVEDQGRAVARLTRELVPEAFRSFDIAIVELDDRFQRAQASAIDLGLSTETLLDNQVQAFRDLFEGEFPLVFGALDNVVGQSVLQFRELVDQFEVANVNIELLALSEADLVDARQRAITQLITEAERDFASGLESLLNPINNQIETLDEAIFGLSSDPNAVGTNPREALARLEGEFREQLELLRNDPAGGDAGRLAQLGQQLVSAGSELFASGPEFQNLRTLVEEGLGAARTSLIDQQTLELRTIGITLAEVRDLASQERALMIDELRRQNIELQQLRAEIAEQNLAA